MAETLKGKVALITGASSGIGWALAKNLSAEGCAVGLVARREPLLKTLAEEIEQGGGKAAWAVGDVRNRGSLEAAISTVRAALGPIDLAIANAGIGKATALNPVNVAEVEEMFQVNVLGVVYTFAAVMPEMLARKAGRLVAISSLAGFRGLPGESAYCASKAAVNSYMDGLRIHLRGTGVSATTICPGFIKTPMTADFKFHMPGLMTADRAARIMVRRIKQGKKMVSFPRRLELLTKLSRWAPDRLVNWMMGDYNEQAKQGKSI